MAYAYLRIDSYPEWLELEEALRSRAVVVESQPGQRLVPAVRRVGLAQLRERLPSSRQMAASVDGGEDAVELTFQAESLEQLRDQGVLSYVTAVPGQEPGADGYVVGQGDYMLELGSATEVSAFLAGASAVVRVARQMGVPL